MKKTVTELTSKKLKLLLGISYLIFYVSIPITFIDSFLGFSIMGTGAILVIIMKIKIWWEHS